MGDLKRERVFEQSNDVPGKEIIQSDTRRLCTGSDVFLGGVVRNLERNLASSNVPYYRVSGAVVKAATEP